MDRIAIIDMGTNTFHLLIAEAGDGKFQILFRDHVATKIGMAGINEGVISESGSNRAIQAMQQFKNTIAMYNPLAVYAFGTSALRNATNGKALAEKIKSLTGISIDIISGDKEADYIYQGVKIALDLGGAVNLIMDIGAGSVEFILADQLRIYWKQSVEIGGQRLLEKFQKHDPIHQDEIHELNTFFDTSLIPLWKACEKFQPVVLVGSSGSFETLSDIFCIKNGIPLPVKETETPLSVEGFFEIYNDLIRKNRSERMKMKGMIEMRVDMIVVACCLIRFVLEKNKFHRIRVSTYSLKEGALAHYAKLKIKY